MIFRLDSQGSLIDLDLDLMIRMIIILLKTKMALVWGTMIITGEDSGKLNDVDKAAEA